MSGTHAKRAAVHRRLRFIAGTVVVACLVWAFTALPYDILREERARLFGEEVTVGSVVKAYSDPSSGSPEANLVVDYKFVDSDGLARTASARVPDSAWTKYRQGRTIKVIYVTSRPEISRLPDEVEPAFQVWLRKLMN